MYLLVKKIRSLTYVRLFVIGSGTVEIRIKGFTPVWTGRNTEIRKRKYVRRSCLRRLWINTITAVDLLLNK